jgi:hypothetical protein
VGDEPVEGSDAEGDTGGDFLSGDEGEVVVPEGNPPDAPSDLSATVISSTEIEQAKADLISQSGGQEALAKNLVAAEIAPSNFERYVRAIITSNKIQDALKASGVADADLSARISQLINAKAAELTVKVNPRYGTGDQDTGDIVATDSAGSAVVPSGK